MKNPIKEEFIKISQSPEILAYVEILTNVERHGLMVEVMHTALNEMKQNPDLSPLLCLQIAAEDWDV